MPIGSVLIGLALGVIVLPYVFSPFLRRGAQNGKAKRAPAAAPKTARKEVLLALRDLDFDFRTGKVTEEDYLPLRAQLVAQAAAAVQAEASARPSPSAAGTVDDPIEAAVRSTREARKAGGAMACPHCQIGVKASDKFCPRCGQALSRSCPECQAIVRTDDKFCARCGATLAPQATPAP